MRRNRLPATPFSVPREERALSLVRQVVLLMLEGRSGGKTVTIAAPIPEHASALLSGLLSPHQPYHCLSDLKGQLEATRERPTRVTSGMRAGHLAVLGTLLGTGLVMMFSLALGYNGLVLDVLSEDLARSQEIEYLLQGDSLKMYLSERWPLDEKLDANFTIGRWVYPTVGPADIERIFGDPEFHQMLRERTAERRLQLERRLDQTSWLDRWMWRSEHQQAARVLQQHTVSPAADFTPEVLVEAITSIMLPSLFFAAFITAAMLMAVGSISLVWMLWPLLIGAGLSYRIAGISLVRRDGRPANRLQCAWRAILIWAPVTALLAASIILQAASPDLVWFATSLAWGALLLLIVYTLLALWFPTRSLHDVLAGTWLVPK